MRRLKHTVSTLVITMALSVLALSLSVSVSANGGQARAEEVYIGPVGPYWARVMAAPVVGNMHADIFLSLSDGETPVEDATLQLSGQIQGEEIIQTAGPEVVYSSLAGPNWQSVNILVEEAGEWVFLIAVEGPQGQASVALPVEVQEAGSGNWLGAGVMGVFLVLLALLSWWGLSWNRRGTSKSAHLSNNG